MTQTVTAQIKPYEGYYLTLEPVILFFKENNSKMFLYPTVGAKFTSSHALLADWGTFLTILLFCSHRDRLGNSGSRRSISFPESSPGLLIRAFPDFLCFFFCFFFCPCSLSWTAGGGIAADLLDFREWRKPNKPKSVSLSTNT